jgi:hypothetical protein
VIAILITAVFGPVGGQRDPRHRHLQHPRLRPADPRRGADALDARFHRWRRGWRARAGAHLGRAHPAQHRQPADRAGHDPVLAGHLAEAGLSYVGLGAQPPTPSWGRMLAEAQTLVSLAPHVALFPGLAIVLTVLGLNLMGDGLRDALDPRLRRAR